MSIPRARLVEIATRNAEDLISRGFTNGHAAKDVMDHSHVNVPLRKTLASVAFCLELNKLERFAQALGVELPKVTKGNEADARARIVRKLLSGELVVGRPNLLIGSRAQEGASSSLGG